MDFQLPEDILFLKNNIRDFIRNEVDPFAQEIEETDDIPKVIMNMSKEIGLFGLSIPEQYGGLGINMVGKCALFEELGKTHNGYTTVIGAHNGMVRRSGLQTVL
jgi:acyl-CoA dehydrogenase